MTHKQIEKHLGQPVPHPPRIPKLPAYVEPRPVKVPALKPCPFCGGAPDLVTEASGFGRGFGLSCACGIRTNFHSEFRFDRARYEKTYNGKPRPNGAYYVTNWMRTLAKQWNTRKESKP